MLCAVLSPLHVDGRRLEPGAEVSLDAGTYRRLAALGVVRLAEEHRAIEEAKAEADRFREAAEAEAEADRDRLLAEAEAPATEPALELHAPVFAEIDRGALLDDLPEPDPEPTDDLDSLDRDALKAIVRDEALEGVDLRLGDDRLREAIRRARLGLAEA